MGFKLFQKVLLSISSFIICVFHTRLISVPCLWQTATGNDKLQNEIQRAHAGD